MSATVATRLLNHYRANARELPWRSPPGGQPPNPYRVWLSEVMLQQTTVAAVTPRFLRFVERWPTVEALAAAPDEEVLSEWAGLGYYARARNLIACSRAIVARGGFPTDEAGWRELPGIGAYTAAAIAAIAFGRRAVVVDTNVERIVARLFALSERREIRPAAETLTPEQECGDFAQAMMDLGATICRPKAPDCPRCPLRDECRAAAVGTPEVFPTKISKAAKPVRHGVLYWHQRNGAVRLVRRSARGMLGGMAALPGSDWSTEPSSVSGPLASVRHDFTHFSLRLAVVSGDGQALPDGWWHPLDQIHDAGLPTLYRKAVSAVLRER